MDDDLLRRLDDTKKGAAILAACIVRTIDESEPIFKERFLSNLEKCAADAQDAVGTDCLELFTWTREVLSTADLHSLLRPTRQ